MVAYMRDNNIFISNLDYGTDNAITKDGKLNEIINGIPDWAYEEEFGMLTAMRWSADDNTLAYIRFDESKVPVYKFDTYKSFCEENPLSDPYPGSYSYKYPLAGYPNSTVSVHAYNLDTRSTKTMDLDLTGAYIPCMDFDGEGRNLMVMVLNRDQNDLKVYRVNPGSTVARAGICRTERRMAESFGLSDGGLRREVLRNRKRKERLPSSVRIRLQRQPAEGCDKGQLECDRLLWSGSQNGYILCTDNPSLEPSTAMLPPWTAPVRSAC